MGRKTLCFKEPLRKKSFFDLSLPFRGTGGLYLISIPLNRQFRIRKNFSRFLFKLFK